MTLDRFTHRRHCECRRRSLTEKIFLGAILGVLKAVGYALVACWRCHEWSVSVVSGRSIERCGSLHRYPALGLGVIAWLSIAGGVVCLGIRRSQEQWAGLAILIGGGLLLLVRLLVRRGC